MTETIPALAIESLGHRFGGRRALEGVSFEVPAGSFTVLLGLNGAGKSTLFSLITRLYDAREGTIRVFGYDIASASGEALRRLGVVFQPRTIDLDLTVMQNLVYDAALHGIGPAEARRRAVAALDRLGLAERAGEKVRKLSGGQVRRAEIARALLHGPRLLLLDEATAGLDVGSRAALISHVRRLAAEQAVGVLWATHLIEEVSPGDQVVVLHRGRVLAKGAVEDVVDGAGAMDIREAFNRLTSLDRPDAEDEAA